MLVRIAIAAALLGACATPTTVESLCQRASDCHDLPADTSVQDCIDLFNGCVDKLPSSERDDWDRMVNNCLSDESCKLFDDCYGTVPWC